MPFQSAPNMAVLEWVQLIHGQVVENTYHVQADVPISGAVLEDAAAAAYDWWNTVLSATLSFDITLLRVEAKSLDEPTSPFFIHTPAVLAVGDAGVEACANNVSFAIKHSTAVSGRSGRGRWYMAGIPRTLVTNSQLGLAQAALYTAAFPLLDTALQALDLQPVVCSRRAFNVARVLAIGYPITAHSFSDADTDSQRRRLRGRGS